MLLQSFHIFSALSRVLCGYSVLFSFAFRNTLTMSRVEFAILGAGAIGSIIGAHLVRAGHSVVMLVRERRAEQLRRDGLVIRGLVEHRHAGRGVY